MSSSNLFTGDSTDIRTPQLRKKSSNNSGKYGVFGSLDSFFSSFRENNKVHEVVKARSASPSNSKRSGAGFATSVFNIVDKLTQKGLIEEAVVTTDEDLAYWISHSSISSRRAEESDCDEKTEKHVLSMLEGIERRSKVSSFIIKEKGQTSLVLKHDSRVRILWDLVILTLILGTAVVTPFHHAFLRTKCREEFCETYFVTYFGFLVDFIFVLDVVMNFHTSFKDANGKRITTTSKIARAYMKGWFLVDVVSALPWTGLASLVDPRSGREHGPDYTPLTLLKLLRVTRALHIYQRISEKMQLSGYIDLVQAIGMYFILFCFGHWTSCGFWIVVNVDDPTIAFQGYFEETGIAFSKHIVEKYIASIYWSVVTLTTIGYGDISPSSTEERLFCGLVCIGSVSVFSYLIATASSLVEDRNVRSSHFKAEAKEIMMHSIRNELPHDLRRRMHLFHRYRHAHNRDTDEKEVLSKLSRGMQLEIALVCHERHLKKVPSFKNASKDFFERMCSVVSTEFFAPNEIIYREGDYGDSMYVMTKGMALLHFRAGSQTYIIHQGRPFGDIAVLGLARSKRPGTVNTITHCETSRIMKEDLSRILEYYPQEKMQIRVDALWSLVRKAFGLARHFVKERTNRASLEIINYLSDNSVSVGSNSFYSSTQAQAVQQAEKHYAAAFEVPKVRSLGNYFPAIQEDLEDDGDSPTTPLIATAPSDNQRAREELTSRVFNSFTTDESSVSRVPSRVPPTPRSLVRSTSVERLEREINMQQEMMTSFHLQTAQKLEAIESGMDSEVISSDAQEFTVDLVAQVKDAILQDLKVEVVQELKEVIVASLKGVAGVPHMNETH